MSEQVVYDQITGRTKAAFGKSVNPQLSSRRVRQRALKEWSV
jgi:hypothetical protein